MGLWIVRGLALAIVMGAPLPGAPTGAQQRIPAMTVPQAEALPPSQRPRIFRDPDPYSYYPYTIHETDGLSRNPDDCIRWGCVDQNGR